MLPFKSFSDPTFAIWKRKEASWEPCSDTNARYARKVLFTRIRLCIPLFNSAICTKNVLCVIRIWFLKRVSISARHTWAGLWPLPCGYQCWLRWKSLMRLGGSSLDFWRIRSHSLQRVSQQPCCYSRIYSASPEVFGLLCLFGKNGLFSWGKLSNLVPNKHTPTCRTQRHSQ